LRLFAAISFGHSRGTFLCQRQVLVIVALLAPGGATVPAGRHGRILAVIFASLDARAVCGHACLSGSQVGLPEWADVDGERTRLAGCVRRLAEHFSTDRPRSLLRDRKMRREKSPPDRRRRQASRVRSPTD